MDKSKILLILSVIILVCSIVVARYQSSTAYTNFTNLTSKLLNTNDTTLNEDHKPVEENVYYNPFGGEYGENRPFDTVLTNQGDLYYDPFGEGLQYVTEKPESIAGITPSNQNENTEAAADTYSSDAYTAEDDLNMINSMMNNNQVSLFNADTTANANIPDTASVASGFDYTETTTVQSNNTVVQSSVVSNNAQANNSSATNTNTYNSYKGIMKDIVQLNLLNNSNQVNGPNNNNNDPYYNDPYYNNDPYNNGDPYYNNNQYNNNDPYNSDPYYNNNSTYSDPYAADNTAAAADYTTANNYDAISSLPAAIQNNIRKAFPNKQVSYVAYDDWDEIKVSLSDGTLVEYHPAGYWKEIQSYNGIPASAFPPAVYRTAKRYYPNALIYKAERDNGRFELKLNNMMEIYISGSGAFLGREYDD